MNGVMRDVFLLNLYPSCYVGCCIIIKAWLKGNLFSGALWMAQHVLLNVATTVRAIHGTESTSDTHAHTHSTVHVSSFHENFLSYKGRRNPALWLNHFKVQRRMKQFRVLMSDLYLSFKSFSKSYTSCSNTPVLMSVSFIHGMNK